MQAQSLIVLEICNIGIVMWSPQACFVVPARTGLCVQNFSVCIAAKFVMLYVLLCYVICIVIFYAL